MSRRRQVPERRQFSGSDAWELVFRSGRFEIDTGGSASIGNHLAGRPPYLVPQRLTGIRVVHGRDKYCIHAHCLMNF